MRYYSSRHVLVFGAICVAATLVITLVMGILGLPMGLRLTQAVASRGQQAPIQGTSVQFTDSPAIGAPGAYSEDERQNIQVYRLLNDAVVNVTSITFSYNWFLEPIPQEGTGSGSIINEDGTVLTNYHVVKDAEKLAITLADGSNYDGRVVGADPENDLAVVKFDPKGHRLSTVPLGTSQGLQVGQKVLAIGNPFALERTLTTGIVSGLGRPVRTGDGMIIKEMIQTDASINPGNSGGPLLNSRGEMIGINTMIYSPSGGSVGIGFAVPVDTARRVLPDLIRYGSVKRGWIEIVPVQLFPQLVRYADLPVSAGVLVSEVVPGGNAEKAGFQGGSQKRAVRAGRNVIYLGGDIIIEADGVAVASLGDLYGALEDNKPGEKVKVKVMRGRAEKVLDVVLAERK
jgi:S1-C subfamily serine protease